MATQRQKKLAKELIKNSQLAKPKNAGELLENVGYAKNTAEAYPGDVIDSKGVKEELKKLGFDEDNAKRVVGEILNKSEDNNRLKAADLVFKVHGSYAAEKHEVQVFTLEELFTNAKQD